MSAKKTVVYFVIPLGVTLMLVAMYFSGVPALQKIVTPRISGMSPNTAREFGLLENLQNVVLLAMLVMMVMGFRRKTTRIEKTGMAFLASFTLFVFLEEIDYGLHIYEYARGIKWNDAAEVRNLHNLGETNKYMKQSVDTGMVILFLIFPLAFANSKRPLLHYLCPDRYSILTLLAMVIVRTVAHALGDRGLGEGGTIQKNLSEFRELVVYYLFMLYVLEITLRRTLEFTTSAPSSPSAA